MTDTFEIWCDRPYEDQPKPTHRDPRPIRHYDRETEGAWTMNPLWALTGTARLPEQGGMREVFDPTPDYLRRDESDELASSKLRCRCGVNYPVPRADVLRYVAAFHDAGEARISLDAFGKLHKRYAERTRRKSE